MDMSLSKLQEMAKDWEAWCTVVHGVSKSWTWLSDLACMYAGYKSKCDTAFLLRNLESIWKDPCRKLVAILNDTCFDNISTICYGSLWEVYIMQSWGCWESFLKILPSLPHEYLVGFLEGTWRRVSIALCLPPLETSHSYSQLLLAFMVFALVCSSK